MRRELRATLIVFLLLSAITGLAYPGVVTLIARVVFPEQASGSVIERNGRALGSRLIGQAFSGPRYLWGRPSATNPHPYNGESSSGSNQGATNPALTQAIGQRIAALKEAHPAQTGPVPVSLVTASASGLDPHISPAAADYQIGRVARARGLDERIVRDLIREATEGRTFGVLGEPRVNVLDVNLALDALAQ